MKFYVIDSETGAEPDQETIALNEEWAQGLVYCDMNGFVIDESGCLYLTDECGNWRACPNDRFRVIFEGAV